MNHYVMVMRDTRYWLVGPFTTHADAGRWGGETYDLDADPHWQTIELVDANSAPVIMDPGTATQFALAGEPV